MPFADKPAMVMSIDIFQKITARQKKYVAGIVATIDRHFGKYHSDVYMCSDIVQAHQSIYLLAKGALERFKQVNNGYCPQNIIVYREGSSEGQIQTLLETEMEGSKGQVEGIRKAMQELGLDNTKLMVIMVNKKSNAKVFTGDAL